ncbi:MAG: PilZ domain-containing protein [Gaiellales bacterium]
MARAILPELPFDVDAYKCDGAASTLRIYAEEDGHVHAMMPWAEAREDMALVIPIRSQDRGGYDIACHVASVYFEGGSLGRVDLAITAVSRRKPYRAVVRAHTSQLALVTVVASRHQRAGEEFDVRLVDLSVTGFAFLTERKLAAGDIVALGTQLGDANFSAEARVVNPAPAPYGRRRMGCEILEPTPAQTLQLERYVEAQPAAIDRRTTDRAA